MSSSAYIIQDCTAAGVELSTCSILYGYQLFNTLSRSLGEASLPSTASTAPPNLVSLANLLSVHSTPVSRSLIKKDGHKSKP